MARKDDPLTPVPDHHPYRARFVLPNLVVDGPGVVFDDPDTAARDPGAGQLLSVPGVAVVAMERNRVSILRQPDAAWEQLLPQVQQVLRTDFLGRQPFESAAAEDAGSEAGKDGQEAEPAA